MEAPLGNIVRRILSNQIASKKLMQQIIEEKSDIIHLDDKRIKILRVASLSDNYQKHSKR